MASQEEVPGEGVFCNECGWRNPSGANFCSRCGAQLQSAPAVRQAAPPPAGGAATRPSAAPAESAPASEGAAQADSSGAAKRIGVLVGATVLIVAALFVITSMSEDDGSDASPGEPSAAAQGGGAPAAGPAAGPTGTAPATTRDLIAEAKAAPLPAAIAEPADSLLAVIGEAEGEVRLAAQRRLTDLYVGAGRVDRAGIAQREIAQATGASEDWERAASFLYDWMASAEGEARFTIADLTAEAYEEVVAQEPGNLGLRTNMAMAYLASRSNPMRGIQEVKSVLEEDPDQVQALFVYGYALAQIGRTDQAIQQFEHARDVAGDGSPRAEQATQIIETLRQAGSDPAGNTPAGSAPAGSMPTGSPSASQ